MWLSQSPPCRRLCSDYSTVTELPGDRVTGEAARMLRTRYGLAAGHCQGRDVLELGCGPALGLAFLARRARRVVGGDRTYSVLRAAAVRSSSPMPSAALPLLCLDAQDLPFAQGPFEVILLFEALYYLASAERFLQECMRVLKPHGEVLVSLPNCRWPGFHPSPYSTGYFPANQLYHLFEGQGFAVEVYGAFPSRPATTGEKLRDHIRRAAVQGHLIPKTFKGKEKLKRLFYGPLHTIGSEFDGDQPIDPLCGIAAGEEPSEYRILYAVGRSTR